MAEKFTDIIEMKPLEQEQPVSARRQSFANQHVQHSLERESDDEGGDKLKAPFTWRLLEEHKYSLYIKRFFRFIAIINILSLAVNGPAIPAEYLRTTVNEFCEDKEKKRIHFIVLLVVDIMLSLLFTLLLLIRMQNSHHWHKLRRLSKDTNKSSGIRSEWLNYNHWVRLIPISITTIGLYGSVVVESVRLTRSDFEIPSPCYIIFVLRVVTLVSAVKFFSPLKISSNALQSLITKFRLKHLANVTVFYFAALYIFALIGVHEIGPLDYRCISDRVMNNDSNGKSALQLCWDVNRADDKRNMCNDTVSDNSNDDNSNDDTVFDDTCVSLASLSVPDLHCHPCNSSEMLCNSSDMPYTCPDGYSCRKVNIGRNLGYYGHYDNLGVSLLTVYEVSTLELWSFQSYTALYSGHGIYAYYTSIIFLLVIIIQQSIFLVVIIESFADIRNDSNLIIRSKPQPRPDFLLTDNSRTDELEFTQTHALPRKRSEFLQLLRKNYWPRFTKFMIVLVLFDAIIVAARGNGMKDYSSFVAIWEVIISVVFVLELLPYMAYYTPSVAIRRWQFWYLSIVAIGSLVGACVIKARGYDNFNGPERVLVVFQSLRFLRLTFLYSHITKFFNDIIGKDRRIPVITVITVYFIFAIALIHFQLFSHTSNGQEDIPGYRSFIGTFRNTFQILTGEGWTEVMSELMFRNSFWWVLNILFILTHLFASLILLNLFVAIILDNLDKDEEKKRKELQELVQSTEDDVIPYHLQLLDRLKIAPTVRNRVKVAGVFDVPNIDESAVREYVQQGEQKLQEAVKEQHNNRKRRSYIEDDYEEEETFVDSTDGDKLQLINVDSGQLLTVSSKRKSESVDQMVERISMWRRWSVSSENTEFDHNNNRLLRHIQAHHTFSEDLMMKPHKHTMLDEYLKTHPYIDWSFFLFRNENSIRKLCKMILEAKLGVSTNAAQKDDTQVKVFVNKAIYVMRSVISQQPYFTWIMLFATASLVIVQLHQLQNDFSNISYNCSNNSSCRKHLYHNKGLYVTMDIIFVLLTVIELSMKAVAYGLFCGPHRVIHSIWDLVSWLIVFGTVVVLAKNYTVPPVSLPSDIDYFAAFMLILWALRPVRIISIVPAMKRGVADILKGKLNFLMAFILLGGFLFMFASLGVQLFQNKFRFCNDFSKSPDNCTGAFEVYIQVTSELIVQPDEETIKILVPCVTVQQPREFGFDHFGDALLTLLETITLEGWISVRDFQQSLHNTLYSDETNPTDVAYVVYVNLYLHIFVFFAVTIGLQLFVGIIVSSFNENKSEHSGLLTVSQKRWIDLLHRIQLTRPVKLPPKPEKTEWNYYPYKILHGRWQNVWKYVVVIMIVLNSLLLSFPWKKLNEDNGESVPDENLLYLRILFIIFQVFFVFSVVLHLLSDGYVYFFLSARNTVEFLFAVASVAYIILAVTFECLNSEQKNSVIVPLINLALGLTVVRLVNALWKFNVLVNLFYTVIATVINSIPLLVVLLVVFFFYAMVGTLLFSNVRTGDAINYSFVNFANTTNSLWTMVRVLTGEDWHLIMHDCAVNEPVCHYCDCGNKILSYLYFLSFNILIVFIFVNVFIAVLLESFSLFYNEDDSCLDHAIIKDFVLIWSKFDQKASGRIPRERIKLFMRCLKLDKFYTYSTKDGVRERKKYEKKKHSLLLREIALELSMEVKTTGQNSNWSQRVPDMAADTPITFENMLKTLAYRTEDIYKRLTPLELKAREEMEVDIQSRVAFDCIKSWMEKYVKPILLNNQSQQTIESSAEAFHNQTTEHDVRIEVRTAPKDLRRRKSFHRHSIVENPQWMIQHSEDNLSDMNSSASLRGNKQPRVLSPSNSEDKSEIRETLKSSLRQGGNQVQQPSTSYNSQFDWKRWYNEKVDSDDD